MQYASMRYLMDQKLGKLIEVLVTYEPKLSYICEWWKQLFGESEGKTIKDCFRPVWYSRPICIRSANTFRKVNERCSKPC